MPRSYDIAILSQKVEQIEGSIKANDVIANPTGAVTTDLSKVQIDGTIYGVSNVNANPTGEATTDLTKVEIDGVKYDISLNNAEVETLTVSGLYEVIITRIGNLRALKIFAAGTSENASFVEALASSDRPANNVSSKYWVQKTEAGAFGTAQFTVYSNGNIGIDIPVFRGVGYVMYIAAPVVESTRSKKKTKKED